jgi:diaminohydroxyphosphoribosylaminopyrimidine deaminase/5-amino-6-(5-phosphoribosylamino)uracil reductase
MTANSCDHEWMRVAIELDHQCPPSPGAYSVGAVIVDHNGELMSRAYSRETDSQVHAEESAPAKLHVTTSVSQQNHHRDSQAG